MTWTLSAKMRARVEASRSRFEDRLSQAPARSEGEALPEVAPFGGGDDWSTLRAAGEAENGAGDGGPGHKGAEPRREHRTEEEQQGGRRKGEEEKAASVGDGFAAGARKKEEGGAEEKAAGVSWNERKEGGEREEVQTISPILIIIMI